MESLEELQGLLILAAWGELLASEVALPACTDSLGGTVVAPWELVLSAWEPALHAWELLPAWEGTALAPSELVLTAWGLLLVELELPIT